MGIQLHCLLKPFVNVGFLSMGIQLHCLSNRLSTLSSWAYFSWAYGCPGQMGSSKAHTSTWSCCLHHRELFNLISTVVHHRELFNLISTPFLSGLASCTLGHHYRATFTHWRQDFDWWIYCKWCTLDVQMSFFLKAFMFCCSKILCLVAIWLQIQTSFKTTKRVEKWKPIIIPCRVDGIFKTQLITTHFIHFRVDRIVEPKKPSLSYFIHFRVDRC